MSTPNWAVLYNGPHFRRYAFFFNEREASAFYAEKSQGGLVPTMRPFHENDRLHLGCTSS